MSRRFALLSSFVAVVCLSAACSSPGHTTHTLQYPSGAPQWRQQVVNGVPDGDSVTWHANGQMASRGTYCNGVRCGVFHYWTERGDLVRRDRYDAGRLVSSQRGGGWAPPVSSPSAAPGAARAAPRVAASQYAELRMYTGSGATRSLRLMGDGDRADGHPMVVVGASGLVRRGKAVVGVSIDTGSTLIGPTHTHGSLVAGLATKPAQNHVELLGEVGFHAVSGIGTGLFTEVRGNNQFETPFAGLQGRFVLDPGAPKGVVLDLSVRGRMDLGRGERSVSATTCLFGCTTTQEQWAVGGASMDVTLGIGYQFD